MPANKLCLDDFRDVRKALVVQYAINVLSIVFTQLFFFELLGLLIFLLEFLQTQSHTANASLVETFGG